MGPISLSVPPCYELGYVMNEVMTEGGGMNKE